jgi:hypothetical protein
MLYITLSLTIIAPAIYLVREKQMTAASSQTACVMMMAGAGGREASDCSKKKQ